MSIEEITYTIFSKQPQPSNSIQLDYSNFNLDAKELFEELLMMFTQGMKILYGNSSGKVDLINLTQKDFDKVNDYFHSFGFNITYTVILPNSLPPIEITSKQILKDYSLRLKCQDNIYIVSFDHYIPSTKC